MNAIPREFHPTSRFWMPLVIGLASWNSSSIAQEPSFAIQVLPPEAKRMTDPEMGTSLLFLTMNLAEDQNLYYEQRSLLANDSLSLFRPSRTNGGLMGCVTKTSESFVSP